jgi:hypothetical protein
MPPRCPPWCWRLPWPRCLPSSFYPGDCVYSLWDGRDLCDTDSADLCCCVQACPLDFCGSATVACQATGLATSLTFKPFAGGKVKGGVDTLLGKGAPHAACLHLLMLPTGLLLTAALSSFCT